VRFQRASLYQPVISIIGGLCPKYEMLAGVALARQPVW